MARFPIGKSGMVIRLTTKIYSFFLFTPQTPPEHFIIIHSKLFLPPRQKEVMLLVVFLCLSLVSQSVCGQHYSKCYEWIGMKFYEGVLSSTMKNWLNFGGELGLLRWENEQNNTIIAVGWPDRDAGNDPEPLGLAFHHQGSNFYSGQYGSNDLLQPRRSALCKCF